MSGPAVMEAWFISTVLKNEYIMLFIAAVNNYQDRTTCAAGVGIQSQSSV